MQKKEGEPKKRIDVNLKGLFECLLTIFQPTLALFFLFSVSFVCFNGIIYLQRYLWPNEQIVM